MNQIEELASVLDNYPEIDYELYDNNRRLIIELKSCQISIGYMYNSNSDIMLTMEGYGFETSFYGHILDVEENPEDDQIDISIRTVHQDFGLQEYHFITIKLNEI